MSSRPYRVMIDAGHGGRDPGAVNKELNIKEKDINLPVARFMRHYINTGDYLYSCYLTRDKDEFLSLDARCTKANTFSCSAFLSIHCNARHLPGENGIELEVFHYRDSAKGREYAGIVLDMLLKDIGREIVVTNRGVKVGGYYVLKHTTMPAILVELGFITDNEEALFLNKVKNQVMIAKALNEATELFLEGG